MRERISKSGAELLALYYVMSNCKAFLNSNSSHLSGEDEELLSFMRNRVKAPLPLFGSKREFMAIRRDIAKHTLEKFISAFDIKCYRIAREHLSNGVNSEIQKFSGQELYDLAKLKLSYIIDVFPNPFVDNKDREPIVNHIIGSCYHEFIEARIMAGLVTP